MRNRSWSRRQVLAGAGQAAALASLWGLATYTETIVLAGPAAFDRAAVA